ncbi:damage-inducible protein DinB [Rhizobiales bacterium]|uniref:DinB family protein n=1 Tax=Hongsoonwoonella zoysiae TaxID=2821844 RepID=UPI0015616962|nr:DinB family protein [Hongsoonwoonella zoysiae]NRG18925.1 damage-inducible protein DinB [Hongsoonwoonella zoysiae]
MKAALLMFAEYNRWANARILKACDELTSEEYHRDLGAFFRSVHGTLDHLLVADLIWMHRFTGLGDSLDSLDEVLTEDFASLKERRESVDGRILGFIQQLNESDIMRPILYRTIRKPLVMEQPLGSAMFHFFNHQTHHRGQAHAFLTMLGKKPEALDMIYFQRETGIGMSKDASAA